MMMKHKVEVCGDTLVGSDKDNNLFFKTRTSSDVKGEKRPTRESVAADKYKYKYKYKYKHKYKHKYKRAQAPMSKVRKDPRGRVLLLVGLCAAKFSNLATTLSNNIEA